MKSSHRSALATGILLVLSSCLIFSTQDTFSKQMMNELSVLQVVWGRFVVHALIVAFYLWMTTGTRFLHPKHPRTQITRGFLQIGTTMSVYLALPHIPLADVTALSFCSPIIVTVLSVLILKEKIGPHRIAAVLCGFVGVYLVVQPGSSATSMYHLLAMCSGLFSATYLLLTRTVAGPDEAPATQFNTTATGVVILSILLFSLDSLPPLSMLPLLVLIGTMSAAGHFILVKGLSHAPASLLSPYLYSQVLFAAIYSVFWFHDSLRPAMIAGTLVLVGSGLYIWWRERKQHH